MYLTKQLNKIFLLTVVLFLLYFNLVAWQQAWLGWILFVIYLVLVGDWWREILRRLFGMNGKTWMIRVLAWLTSFLLLGLVSSIFVVFNKLSLGLIWWVYLLVALLTLIIYSFLSRQSYQREVGVWTEQVKEKILFKKSLLLPILYVILWLAGFYLLLISKSNTVLQSPWQTISEYYLPIFFVLTLLSGIFLFARYKIKMILFIFILQSILLHLYLPLSHQQPWGGDVWRHLAIESQIEEGRQILPVLVGPEAEWQEKVGVDVPKVFFSPQKYTYSQLWGTTVLLSQTLQADLITVNKWLVPILWSIVMPFILFRIGWLLFNSRRKGLWLTWLSFLAFPFQALGGLTLPVSLGYLTFFFVLMLWLQYLRDNYSGQKWLVVLFSILMLFGYSLHFILIWLIILFSYILKKIQHRGVGIGLLFASFFILPVVELVSKLSHWPEKLNFLDNIYQLVGQFTGWFYASLIRPHDILSGNILFNHTPDYAFVTNIFTTWRWYLIPLMIIFILLFKYSVWKIVWQKVNQGWGVLVWLVCLVWGGYFIDWYVLVGDRLLTRRLDLLLAFLWLLFVTYALHYILSKCKVKKLFVKISILLAIFILSWFGTMTYASGPDMRVVSASEYLAAEMISNNHGGCVLADTWTLLALEGLTAKDIVGGGFPINYQFGQSERVDLLEQFTIKPSLGLLDQAKELTGAEACCLILDKELVNKTEVDGIYGVEAQKVDNLLVWGPDLKKMVE